MELRASVRRGIVWLAIIATLSIGYRSTSAGTISGAGNELELNKAVQQGADLERSRKWLEAIDFYEKGQKQYPSSRELEYGLRRAKIHYSIDRRYSDSSFQKSMLTLSRREALGLFDDVLQKIQTYYVDPLSATNFVAHGTESLWNALRNQKFLQQNLPHVSQDRIEKVRTALHDRYWNKPIVHRQGAVDTVSQICDFANAELGLSSGAVVMEYLFGGCNALDDYSSYLTPTRWNDLHGNIEGQFVGLGIEMKAETEKGLLLVNVLPDSPAAEGGLKSGEYIVNIDGTDCLMMTTDEAASLLQGRDGSQVQLGISGKHAQHRGARFTRRAVNVKSIPIARMVDQANGIGYIQLTGFQKNSAEELDAALAQLRREGMRALIWDVRGNPGGLLDAAVEVLDRFIKDGVVVSTRGRMPDQNRYYAAHPAGTLDIPLVLLTDGDSASASEIVAGAIRDLHRGVIVGRPTYGKWSVQSILSVRGSAGMRLTTAKFYSPHGHNYAKVGVKPDYLTPEPNKERNYHLSPTDINLEEDGDLQKGIELLQKQLAHNGSKNTTAGLGRGK